MFCGLLRTKKKQNSMKLIEFKESDSKQIIVTDQGEKEVDENTISSLWWRWVMHPKAKRKDDDEFHIFSFTEPVDYDEFLKKGKEEKKIADNQKD
jgi:hypothetical protein